MITLNDELFLGKGFHKATYQHPSNSELCVKVMINDAKDATDQLHRELAHNLSLQKKHGRVKGLSHYIGQEETNLGMGYLFEIVKDHDGSISKSLSDYLSVPDLFGINADTINHDLVLLKQNMVEQSIIPMRMESHNILYRKINKNNAEFVIIDDIGTAALIPLEYIFSFAAKARIERKWKALENQLIEQFNFDASNSPIIA